MERVGPELGVDFECHAWESRSIEREVIFVFLKDHSGG